MNLRTILVDDEEDARALLKIVLQQAEGIEIIAECKDGKEALEAITRLQLELVFLDIQMPELSGLEVVEKLSPPYPYFIFVTAYDEYAIKAFELNAVDYILKPYTEERVLKSVQRAKTLLRNNELTEFTLRYGKIIQALRSAEQANEADYLQRLAVKTNERTLFIAVEDIVLIEASDQYVEVQTADGKYLVRDSMDHLEQFLDPKLFFRTHRSSIINLKEIKALESPNAKTSMVVLNNGAKTRLSSSRKPAFKKVMGL